MRTYLDCIPCFVRHSLDAVRMTTDDEEIHEKVLREAMRLAYEIDFERSPPVTAQKMHSFIREITGVKDPYLKIKKRFNEMALAMYPELKRRIESSDGPLGVAVRLAIAGNIIDYGVNSTVHSSQVKKAIVDSLAQPMDTKAFTKFTQAIGDAKDILYLGDNAGEIVLDRLLIEQLPLEKVTYVVKGGPILNDVLLEDAVAVGLADIVEVMDNGSDAPGTILDNCSEDFRRRFEQADMVIAKGQGNYETLSDVERDVFFMLQPKCAVLAEHLDCELRSLVLKC